ncbi:FAD-binding oxidoreductase [Patulibacter defluvii]|uniref:FAD-binding oxidoreductase n=1 Tax=Patulibacter defluvii TaxID=3095358 RepID=UPI002A7656DA|nr:FAD-dependent oxidoreductase [Patulibacter sp. DM4]
MSTPLLPTTPSPLIVRPDDEAYDTARRAWNLAVDQRPAAVCVATSVADVQAAVRYARAHGLRIAAQATGHLAAALGSLDRTLLLRTALHDGEVAVDPIARRVRIQAGALWGEVAEACAPHGLTVLHGSSPTVGVIGYLLGGGLSFYAREHGLAVNHVTAFEVVTADGAARRVDAGSDPDLFWALRGGGGGFAIVTAVELTALPIAEVFGGALFFPVDAAPAVVRAWHEWTREAPRSVTTSLRILCLPPLDEVPPPLRATPVVCVDGVALEAADGQALVERLLAAATPLLGGWQTMPSLAVLRLHGDPEPPTPGVSDAILLDELDDAAIDAFLALAGAGSGSPLLAAELRQLGGALAEAPAGAGVRGALEGRFLLFGVGVPMGPGDGDAIAAHLRRMQQELGAWATGTRFSSFSEAPATALDACVPAAAVARLREIRATVDGDRLLAGAHPLSEA